ncbi:hypothetical protein [Modicisalibacter xianhensis]|uniref:Uncharacterized protein n=1 Tax=Modicisalibacter xianhensis TaxID=442341 RepID=A0A1I3GC09_9GAMM|nr:hypothetical protein [Halomonas xianhensis]SFI20957.1 hypothetical protein SAMN04487959_12924 [Halomonas xianhensis]
MSLAEVQRIADEFLAGYNGNDPLDLRVVNRQEDAYGPNATRARYGIVKGGCHA